MPIAYGSLAQLVEQVTFNHLVGGSSPSWPTSDTPRHWWGVSFFTANSALRGVFAYLG